MTLGGEKKSLICNTLMAIKKMSIIHKMLLALEGKMAGRTP